MLEIINSYVHGFTAVPILSLCKQLPIFTALEKNRAVNVDALAAELGANKGYCRIIFRALHALGWLASDNHCDYRLTEKYRLAPSIPDNIDDIYCIDFEGFLFQGQSFETIEKWFSLSENHWHTDDTEFQLLLDGPLLVQLVLTLARHNPEQSADYFEQTLFGRLHPSVQDLLHRYLANKKYMRERCGQLTDAGRYLVERTLIMGVTASYKPMLKQLKTLLLGDPRAVLQYDEQGHETYVDRTLNVIGSGFQHDKYFTDILDIITAIFDRQPLDKQPNYIADMGCGDGSLLKTLYTAIANQTLRGKHLDTHPLTVIGVDFNRKSLESSEAKLADIPHLLMHGDIGDPARLLRDLQSLGISGKDDVLHVRSFLDHDRPVKLPQAIPAIACANDCVYVNETGGRISAAEMAGSLREHLQRWSAIIGEHGLILLEVFSLPVSITQQYFSQTESFSFDVYHALSGQALVEAGTFYQALAAAGLFADHKTLAKYPHTLPFSRIAVQHLKRKDFVIRSMAENDIGRLIEIDRLCWPENLRLSERGIMTRFQRFPTGQFVIEYDRQVVGILYTQRVDDKNAVLNAQYANYGAAHLHSGKYWQLLSISVDPQYQSLSLGDRLLEYVLDLAALSAGVEEVIGITRCLDFVNQQRPLAEYIQLRDEQGRFIDPLLRFHQAHGAEVRQLVPGARPEDVDNKGCGVLISYNILQRLGRRSRPLSTVSAEKTIASAAKAGSAATRVADAIKTVMKRPQTQFSANRPLKELGLDSMNLMELRLLLNAQFELDFEPAFFFTYPTGKAIAAYIEQAQSNNTHDNNGETQYATVPAENFSVTEPEPALNDRVSYAAGRHSLTASGRDRDIAIVGMSLRLPGGINSPADYWQTLMDERCVIAARPQNRWRSYRAEFEQLPPELGYIHRGGFLSDIDQFDAAFFRITPVEANALDPQQRLLLELVWESFERAAINPDALKGEAVGVFLGAYTHDYEQLSLRGRALTDIDAYFGTGNALSTAAGRLAYYFDFRGPTLTVDTACSSSSAAIYFACNSLREKNCDLAVASSVNLMLSPVLSVSFARAGMLSADGLCKTFDSDANGYVRSEGCAVLLLKRLAEAEAAGDTIHALIKGAALVQDGSSNGLTAPNGQAQVDVIQQALADAGRRPRDVSYIEAHGTGTYLGDPVEMQSLRSVFSRSRPEGCPLQVASVKTNIGHTEAVSGMAGVIKVVLSLQHQTLPAHLHINKLNSLIKLSDSAIEIPVTAKSWTPHEGGARVAGVSSFGFSGSNTHIVIEEYIGCGNAPVQAPLLQKYPVVLSAKSRPSLQNLVDALLRYLTEKAGTEETKAIDLPALSRTLTLGRAHHHYSIGLVCESVDDLIAQLKNISNEDISASGEQPPIVNELMQRMATGGNAGRLFDLPTYRFDRQSYWLEPLDSGTAFVSAMNTPVIGPLAGRKLNTPMFQCQRSISLSEDDFLSGHLLEGQCIFPATASIEMILEAAHYLSQGQYPLLLRSFNLDQIVRLESENQYTMQLSAQSENDSGYHFDIHALDQPVPQWNKCASAIAGKTDNSFSAAEESPLQMPVDTAPLSGADFYRRLREYGYEYKAPFCNIQQIVIRENEVFASVNPETTPGADDENWILSPWLLDSCFQLALCALFDESVDQNSQATVNRHNQMLLPTRIESLQCFAPLTTNALVHCRFQSQNLQSGGRGINASLHIVDPSGKTLCRIEGFEFSFVNRYSLRRNPVAAGQVPFYVPTWREMKAQNRQTEGEEGDDNRRWLILADSQGYGERIQRSLESRGGQVRLLKFDSVIAGTQPESVSEKLAEEYRLAGPFRGLICCWPIDATRATLGQMEWLNLSLSLLQFIAGLQTDTLRRVVIVTQQTQAVIAGDRVAEAAPAALWGLVSAFRAEYPQTDTVLVDIDEWDTAYNPLEPILNGQVGSDSAESFAVRKRGIYRRYLSAYPPAENAIAPCNGCYLISGGLGGLGRRLTEFFHAQGAVRVVLLSRDPAHRDLQWLQALNRRRDCIEVYSCDITDIESVKTVIGQLGREVVIKGIVHAAGIIDDGVLLNQNAEKLQRVFTPKVFGIKNILECLPTRELDFVWLFSSIIGLYGGAGQSNYAAANAALDGYAHYLRAHNIPAVAINWGSVGGAGMAYRSEQQAGIRQRLFVDFLPAEQLDSIFSALLGFDRAQVCVAKWDCQAIEQAPVVPSLLVEFKSAQQPPAANRREQFLACMQDCLPGEYQDRMKTFLVEKITGITGLSRAAVVEARALSEIGMDSLMAVSLRAQLAESIASSLPATLLFDHPTLDELGEYLLAASGLCRAEENPATEADGASPDDVLTEELEALESLTDAQLLELLGEEYVHAE